MSYDTYFLQLQEFILDKQSKNEPFFIGRLSGNETSLTGKILSGKNDIQPYLIQNMLFVAGIQFRAINDMVQYASEYNTAISHSQILGIWDGAMYSQAIEYYNILNNNYKHIILYHYFTAKVCEGGGEGPRRLHYNNIIHNNISDFVDNKKMLFSSLSLSNLTFKSKNFNAKSRRHKEVFFIFLLCPMWFKN